MTKIEFKKEIEKLETDWENFYWNWILKKYPNSPADRINWKQGFNKILNDTRIFIFSKSVVLYCFGVSKEKYSFKSAIETIAGWKSALEDELNSKIN